MKIYSDSELKNEITTLDLGILEAGESKLFSFYVKNDSNAEYRNLNFAIEHKEVKILEAPKTLKATESAVLKIQWSASVTLKQGLKTSLQVIGTELWG